MVVEMVVKFFGGNGLFWLEMEEEDGDEDGVVVVVVVVGMEE